MNDLEVRQLRYFVAVAEELHFGRRSPAIAAFVRAACTVAAAAHP